MTDDARAIGGARAAHCLPVGIYFEDTDAFGVVYHASYLRFAERARTEMMRGLGYDSTGLRAQHGVAFVVRRCEVDFLAPARLDDMLMVETRLLALRGASIDMLQTVCLGDRELVGMRMMMACMTPEGRAARIPKVISAAFAALAGD